MNRNKLAIGFIVYGQSSAKYLASFVPSLLASIANCGLETISMAWDNGPDKFQANRDILKQFPEITVLGTGANLGFAEANNHLIETALLERADYFLALNPDMLLEPDALKELIQVLEADSQISAVSPKVKHWNFETDEKTDLIDTCGIVIKSGLQFSDLGQAELDQCQYDQAVIAGPSGCAALFRVSTLEQIKDKFGYFDSRIFMYKEDCDLAYRLQRAGLKTALVPSAIFYHDRSADAVGTSLWRRFMNQGRKSQQVRHWSYFSQWLLIFKYWSGLNLVERCNTIYYTSFSLIYALIFDWSLLSEIKRAREAVFKQS